MKCPKCGSEIPEGSLYCETCGTEIRIVKEYDAGLEQQISENMDSIRKEVRRQIEEEEQEKRIALVRRQKKRLRLVAAAAALALILICGTAVYLLRPTRESYVGRAYTAAEKGEYEKAAKLIDAALSLDKSSDPIELILTKTRYLESAGDLEGAEKTIRTVTDSPTSSDDEKVRAYQLLIDIYASKERYQEIAAMIAESPDAVRRAYHAYLSSQPVFSEKSGTYEGSLSLTITDDNGGSIFYTLDGSTPDLHSSLYRSPIALTFGEYTVTAISVNKYGVVSEPVSQKYVIHGEKLEAPEISPESGSYTGSALIRVTAPKAGKVYYTTDGSDPDEESKQYTGPMEMPTGSSSYRFIVIDENGGKSEIVSRNYSLSPAAKISADEGPSYILQALLDAGETADAEGTTPDGTARYSYSCIGSKTITGYGSFYLYREYLVDSTGNAAETGRRFAVNVSNATVNLYGDIGNGDQLFPLP